MSGVLKDDSVEFKWGKKRGIGGKKKDMQFYESFTYDGVEYALYDSVYVETRHPELSIGKIIKIWDTPIKENRAKVLWFFRPCEILNFLGSSDPAENELFLASGPSHERSGLAKVINVEAICGKCNVICVSKDSRNPQPSDEEIQMADFIFYRTFDVGHLTISEKMDEKIAGVDVKNIFNKLDRPKPAGVENHDFDKKEVNGNAIATSDVADASNQKYNECVNVKKDGNSIVVLVKDSVDSNPSSVKQNSAMESGYASMKDVVEASKHDGRLEIVPHGKDMTLSNDKENSDFLEPVVMKKSSVEQPLSSRRIEELKESKKNVSHEKILVRSKVESERSGYATMKNHFREVEVGHVAKRNNDNDGFEVKSPKKAKLDDNNKVFCAKNNNSMSKPRHSYGGDDAKASMVASKGSSKVECAKDSCGGREGLSEKLKLDVKGTKVSHGKQIQETLANSPKVDKKMDGCIVEVTRRPNADRSGWFNDIPWEERMKIAHDQGRLVLFQNLDPALTSSQVEDIVWHGFEQSCTARVVPSTAFSSPHSGQAFVIFKTWQAAEMVIRRINESCLLLSDGRPLVGSIGNPCFQEQKRTFYGHLVIDQLRKQMQRGRKDAVSTSHPAQPNNLEYDMALEWCLLQERFALSFKKLYQQQCEELRKVMGKLKSK